MSARRIDLSGLIVSAGLPEPTDWQREILDGLPTASMTIDLHSPPPPQPRPVRFQYHRKRGSQPFRAAVILDEVGSFTLAGRNAQRFARYMSPAARARLRRMHAAYPRRWRKR